MFIMGGSQSKWAVAEQKGRVVLITGGNSGIGFVAARELGKLGAQVHIAARDKTRGEKALSDLKTAVPEGQFFLEELDVSKLSSVRAFAERWNAKSDATLNTLINNAGIMNTPTRELSEDGFEMQLATNHLGHFALTGLLLGSIRKSADPRIVNVSSIKAAEGTAKDPVDFRYDSGYVPEPVYCESKLCNLFFTLELSKRYSDILCYSAHPGVTATNLFVHSYAWFKPFMQGVDAGALPLIRAAAEESVPTNSYFGPPGMRGTVRSNLEKPKQATNEADALRYWEASVKATGENVAKFNQFRPVWSQSNL